jgi:hypothetical protein
MSAMAAANTCTTLAVDNEELRRYLTTEMRKLAVLLDASRCNLCGNGDVKAFSRICDSHFLGDCCAGRRGNWFKTVHDRRGEHKCCPVDGCRAAPREHPTVDKPYTALVLAGRLAVEEVGNEARVAETRDQAHATAVDAARAERGLPPSRKRQIDCTAEEWADIRATRAEARVAKKAKKARQAHIEKFELKGSEKLRELLGREGYKAWFESEFGSTVCGDAEEE